MKKEDIERAAYIAANAISSANTTAPHLACPGAKQSHRIDTIANIIIGVFEVFEAGVVREGSA